MTAQSQLSPKAKLPLLQLGIVAIATIIATASSFSGAFILDDLRTIVMNERVHSLAHLPELLTHSRRPAVDISLAISGAMAGSWDAPPFDTSPFHFINALVHLLAALTLFDLVRRLMSNAGASLSNAAWSACAIATLWAVHPLQTESVTYIIQRAESLAGLFYLLTLWCMVRTHELPKPKRTTFAIFAVAASALAMGSKGVAVTIPLTALLMDRAFLAGSFLGAIRARWPVYLGLLASLGVLAFTGVAQGVLGAKQTTGPATVGFLYEGISPLTYFISQPAVILHYLRLAFIPAGQCLDYAWQPAGSIPAALPTLIPLVLLGGAALWGLWKNTWWGFAGACFFVILAPTSSFIPIKDLAFEHRMYLPLAAPLVIAFSLLVALLRRVNAQSATKLTAVCTTLAAVALIVATTNRNAVYKSELAMWSDITAKAPHNARAWSNLGMTAARASQPDYPLAERALRNAIDADPEIAAPYVNLANVLARTGKQPEAIELYKTFESRLIEGHSRVQGQQARSIATAASSRGLLMVQSGDVEGAAAAFARAAEHEPDRPDHLVYLARTLAQLDRLDEADEAIRAALQLDPTSEPAQRTELLIRQIRANK